MFIREIDVLKGLKSIIYNKAFDVEIQPTNFFSKSRLIDFSIQLLQLIGIFFIIHLYKIEKNSGLIDYSWIVIVGFCVYSFVKIQYKHLVLLSIFCVIILSAYGLLNGILFLTIGLSIIATCLIKVKFSLKLFLISLLFMIFAIGRTEIFNYPRLTTLITYILPLFMFRAFILIYELKNGLKIKSLWQVIVYFFLLPNIFFLFFPIIDYKTYQNTYYNEPEKDIWQKGIRWMLRGLFHIFAYRIISAYWISTQEEVHDFFSLLNYLTANYVLIIRLSGIFHFIIGLLCMFGMNLPSTFNNYFLATSFVDLWRRINIYWRDFILKLFFYPIMFAYKKKIKKNLLATTMLSVFFITFILHSYQLFWVSGYFSLRAVDLVFWLTVGVLITINSVIIEQQAINGEKSEKKNSFLTYLLDTLKIIGMILFMSVMWGLWSSQSIKEWLYLMSYSKNINSTQILQVCLYLFLIVLIGIAIHYFINSKLIQKLITIKPSKTFFLTAPTIIIVIFTLKVKSEFPQYLNAIIETAANDSPNTFEKNNAEIGYYDRLIEGDEDVTIGIGTKGFKKKLKKNPYNVAYYISDELLNRRMKPNLNIKGLDHDFITNSYGIRDKEYKLTKDNKTFRFALLGGSYEMGSGVSNHQNFEYITEENLNKNIPDSSYNNIEIWNYAAGGYYLIEHLELLNTEVFKSNPDAVIYFAHSDERNKMIQDITNVLKRKTDLKYPFLKKIVEISGIKPTMGNKQIKELLKPYIDCILQWAYIEIAKQCRAHHTKPIFVYLLTTEAIVDKEEFEMMNKFAKQSGYITLDLSDVYKSLPRKTIQISEINTHPNVKGSQLIADDFYKEIILHKHEIFNK